MKMKSNVLTSMIAALVALSGCATSTVGPGAGAAQGLVNGSVDDVSQRAQNVFKEMNIQTTGTSTTNSGNERQLTGTLGDTTVTVTMDNAANSTTNVEVAAGKNLVSGNRDLAKDILTRIVQSGERQPASVNSSQ